MNKNIVVEVLWKANDKGDYPHVDSVVILPRGAVKFFGAFYGEYLDAPYPYHEIPKDIADLIGKTNPFV